MNALTTKLKDMRDFGGALRTPGLADAQIESAAARVWPRGVRVGSPTSSGFSPWRRIRMRRGWLMPSIGPRTASARITKGAHCLSPRPAR